MTRLIRSLKRSFFVAAAALSLLGLPDPLAAQQAAAPADEAVYLDQPPPAPEPTIAQEGPITEPYEDGKPRVERHVRKLSDNQIVNHGNYAEYYRNGQKFAEGAFENGVHQGPWSYWHENGQLAKTVNFKNGLPDGQWESFRAGGTLAAKKSYKDGKRNGKWLAYFKDGKTVNFEQTFVDNKLEGEVLVNFESGKPRIKSVFKNGLREGAATEWDDTGRKLVEANYVGGKLEGKLIRYKPDGATVEEVWRDGKPLRGAAAAAPPANPAAATTAAPPAG